VYNSVGIGTTNPQAPLDIAKTFNGGGTTWNPFQRYTLTTTQAGANAVQEWYNTNDAYVMAQIGVMPGGGYDVPEFSIRVSNVAHALQDRLRINELGDIGIGTTSPDEKLDVEGTGVVFQNNIALGTMNFKLKSQGDTFMQFWNDNLSEWTIGEDQFLDPISDAFIFSSRDTARMMVLTQDGNIGINSSNPAEKLEVVGNFNLTGYALIDGYNLNRSALELYLKDQTEGLDTFNRTYDNVVNGSVVDFLHGHSNLSAGNGSSEIFVDDTGKITVRSFIVGDGTSPVTIGDTVSLSFANQDGLIVKGKLEAQLWFYMHEDAFLYDGKRMRDTSNNGMGIYTKTTTQGSDGGMITLGTISHSLLIVENGDRNFNFAHPVQPDPTLFVHSNKQNTSEWISLAHDQTNAILGWGAGALNLNGGNGKVIIGSDSSPTYPLEVMGNESNISAFFSSQISATGYITRTSIWEQSWGSVWDYIKPNTQLKNQISGKINHELMTPNVITHTYQEKVGETSNITTIQSIDAETNKTITETVNMTILIYQTKQVEGVLLDDLIAKHEQALYELKQDNDLLKSELCKKDITYAWC
ncbi:hypothetical protein LCGC14_2192430, partial [marine sediment metagenome]